MSPIRHLLHKITLTRLRDVAELPNRSKHRETSKMRRQRNIFQMKQQNPRKRNKWNKGKQSTDKEFKAVDIKMLRTQGEEWVNQSELRNKITEMKNMLEGINSRLDDAEK